MIIIVPLVVVIGVLSWLFRPGKKPAFGTKLAIALTAIPALAVGLAAVIFQLAHNASGTIEVSGISNSLFVAGLGLIVVFIVAAIGFALTRKYAVAKSIAFGACAAVMISVVVLGLLEWLAGV